MSIDCVSIESTTLLTNTSSTFDGVYVKVTCADGYQLSSLRSGAANPDIFHCASGLWLPSIPRCVVAHGGVPVAVIAGSVVGGAVCLAIVVAAIFLLCKLRKVQKQEKQSSAMQKSKMMHINFFMSSFGEDNVGMPPVTDDNIVEQFDDIYVNPAAPSR